MFGSLSSPERELQESSLRSKSLQATPGVQKKSQMGLIDRFIAENLKIGPIRDPV